MICKWCKFAAMCYMNYFGKGHERNTTKTELTVLTLEVFFALFPKNKNMFSNCKLWVQLCDPETW